MDFKLSDLLIEAGEDDVKLQALKLSVTNITTRKNGDSRVTFLTNQVTPSDVLTGEWPMVGLVVWIPRATIPPRFLK